MHADLNADSFSGLLARLAPTREQAGEEYEHLRHKLIRFFEWRGTLFPEEHADDVFNRVARKVSEGVEISSVGSYCYEVARLVCFETLKGKDSKRAAFDAEAHDIAVTESDTSREQELRLACLDHCLESLPLEHRNLIVEYYQDDKRDRIERRKHLAARLGLQREALANRAQRLRDKLEYCVKECLRRKMAI